MSRLWKTRLVSFAAVLSLLLIAVAHPVAAVHDDGLFELDISNSPLQGNANIVDSPAGGAEDWTNVYSGNTAAFATTFIEDGYRTTITNADPSRVERSFFTGGGSKDTNGIQEGPWQYDTINDQVPDSDDIVDAFAAAYDDADSGHTIFYFGADRLDWDGDKQIGFWFYRSAVTLGPPNSQGKGSFVGTHSDGDILILADFRNGGRAGQVTVYKWSGNDATGSLVQLSDTAQADCAVVGANDQYCAVVNNSTGENPPWAYVNKDGTASYDGAGALFEGGIDISAVLGTNDIGCFSTFLAETRSSHATTAQLKDFALGAFPVCSIKVTKTGDTLSKIGDPVNYTITIENTGRATLYKRNITDTLLGAIATNGTN
ncbi:MAG TPA: hypothetical protein VFU22_08555, partial [Roseiflexaceae bacterium]|nr:hypothetical protein [Roseiflexaceae bacterium]